MSWIILALVVLFWANIVRVMWQSNDQQSALVFGLFGLIAVVVSFWMVLQ